MCAELTREAFQNGLLLGAFLMFVTIMLLYALFAFIGSKA